MNLINLWQKKGKQRMADSFTLDVKIYAFYNGSICS